MWDVWLWWMTVNLVVLYPDKHALNWASSPTLSGLNKATMHKHTHTHQHRRSSCLLMLCASEPWSRRYRIGGKWDGNTTRKVEREVREEVVFVLPLYCPTALRSLCIQLKWDEDSWDSDELMSAVILCLHTHTHTNTLKSRNPYF